MGKGIDLARMAGAGITADVLDDFKDQLLVCLLKRCADSNGNVDIPVADVDATGDTVVGLAVIDRTFHFEVRKKQ